MQVVCSRFSVYVSTVLLRFVSHGDRLSWLSFERVLLRNSLPVMAFSRSYLSPTIGLCEVDCALIHELCVALPKAVVVEGPCWSIETVSPWVFNSHHCPLRTLLVDLAGQLEGIYSSPALSQSHDLSSPSFLITTKYQHVRPTQLQSQSIAHIRNPT